MRVSREFCTAFRTDAAYLIACQENDNFLLLRGAHGSKGKLLGKCKPLYYHRGWLSTLLGAKEVESTRNAIERDLLPYTI